MGLVKLWVTIDAPMEILNERPERDAVCVVTYNCFHKEVSRLKKRLFEFSELARNAQQMAPPPPVKNNVALENENIQLRDIIATLKKERGALKSQAGNVATMTTRIEKLKAELHEAKNELNLVRMKAKKEGLLL